MSYIVDDIVVVEDSVARMSDVLRPPHSVVK